MKNLYVKLFNVVFDTGIIPEQWTVRNTNPIYKNKGDITKPENYRPITLLSSVGKVFSSILNKRITEYVESIDIINNTQEGFRKGFLTSDNLFLLHHIIQYLNNNEKKLFCSFIDLKQEFEFSHGISVSARGNLFPLLLSMYFIDLKDFFQDNSNASGILLCNDQNMNILQSFTSIYLIICRRYCNNG